MTPRRAMMRVLSLGVLLLGLSCPALAQPSYPVKPMAITRMSGQWILEGKHRTENHHRTNSSSEEKSLRLEESFNLNLLGYAYHPNLVEWGANMQLGLDQNRTQVNGLDQDSDATVMDYSLYALIFQKKIMTIHATASQTIQTIERNFARPIDVDHQNQSLELSWKKAIATSLRIERRTLDETSDVRIDKKKTWFTSLQIQDNRNPQWQSQLHIEHEQTDQTATTINFNGSIGEVLDLPSTRDQLTFQNSWTMSSLALRPNLIGTIRMMKQTGYYENNQLAIQQQLTLHHTDNFETYYDGQFSDDTTSTQQDRLMEVRAGFRWSLYDSMNIETSVRNSDRKLENGSEKIMGVYTDVGYRKKVPIGQYRSTLKISREVEQQTFRGSVRNIRDEAVTLLGLGTATLSQPNVQPGSLIVTDTTNTIIYVQGIDYILSTLGQFTQIARVATGAIVDGQSVLIDYIVNASSSNENTTNSISWTHRLTFKNLWVPLSIYFNYREQNQTLTGGTDPGNLDELKILIMGMDMTLGDFQLGGEVEKREQKLIPNMQATRLRASYTLPLRGNVTLVANGGYEDIRYAQSLGVTEVADFQKTLFADVSATFKASQFLLLRLNGSYRSSEGRQVDDLTRLAAELVFRKGRLDLTLNASYSTFTQQDDQGDDMTLSFRVQRTF